MRIFATPAPPREVLVISSAELWFGPYVLVESGRPTRRSRIITEHRVALISVAAEHPIAMISAADQELSRDEHNEGSTPCFV
ncbi:hypothetical protein U1Q18_019421 [Sarracenia purpurea var. burkii]